MFIIIIYICVYLSYVLLRQLSIDISNLYACVYACMFLLCFFKCIYMHACMYIHECFYFIFSMYAYPSKSLPQGGPKSKKWRNFYARMISLSLTTPPFKHTVTPLGLLGMWVLLSLSTFLVMAVCWVSQLNFYDISWLIILEEYKRKGR